MCSVLAPGKTSSYKSDRSVMPWSRRVATSGES